MSGRKTSNYSYNRQTQERASALVSLQAQQRSLKLLLSTLEGQQKELMDSSQVSISHSGVSIDDWRREVSQATSVILTDSFRNSHRARDRAPPPLYPKPKNITQV